MYSLCSSKLLPPRWNTLGSGDGADSISTWEDEIYRIMVDGPGLGGHYPEVRGKWHYYPKKLPH